MDPIKQMYQQRIVHALQRANVASAFLEETASQLVSARSAVQWQGPASSSFTESVSANVTHGALASAETKVFVAQLRDLLSLVQAA